MNLANKKMVVTADMLKLDLHIHSQYSEDAIGSVKEIKKSIQNKGLQGMAITDHNNVKGGLAAKKIATKEFVVIPGIEISTKEGHLLALNVTKDIQKGLSVEETVDQVYDYGGIPIVPHLFRNMSGIKEEKLKPMVKKLKAIEVYNGCSQPKTNMLTGKVAQKYHLGGTGGSDAHVPQYAGYAFTTVNTSDLSVDSIIQEIERKNTWGEGKTLPFSYRRDRMVKSIKQFFQRGLKRI